MTQPTKPTPSAAEKLEHDAELAGAAAAGGLRAVEVAAVVLLGLLICPPLAILVTVVVVPLLVAALAFGLVVAILSTPYLLIHHFRADHGDHVSLLGQRLRGAGRALFDVLPHRIVADVRKHRSGR